MQTSIRTPNPVVHPLVQRPLTSTRWRWWWAIAPGLALLLGLLVASGLWWAHRPSAPLTAVGRFGVALPRPWATFATSPANRAYLGDPVWAQPFEGRDCVGFEFYIACHDPRPRVRGTPDEYDLVDLGRRSLPAALAPRPSRPDPVVQAYLDQLEHAGVPWRYWFGMPISETFCVTGGAGGPAECVQFFTRQQLRWRVGASVADPDAVQLTPLGVQVPRP